MAALAIAPAPLALRIAAPTASLAQAPRRAVHPSASLPAAAVPRGSWASCAPVPRRALLASTFLGVSLAPIHCAGATSGEVPRTVMSAADPGKGKKVGVLFVCLGNICRSPAAEAVFRHAVQKEGLEDHFLIDSAGTIDYHEGNPADGRMRKAASGRGIDVTSISRPIRPSDFSEFDVILAMDKSNYSDIKKSYQVWKKSMDLPDKGMDKVELMCSYCKKFENKEVPDPYYGGQQGFEFVLDLLDDACSQLLKQLKPRVSG